MISFDETLTERHVQAVWYDANLRPKILRTVRGTPVEVLDPGEWNRESGPDFRQARFRLGSDLVTGDVEVHLRPGDWKAHGHAGDAAYRHVVLHVTWYGGEVPDGLPPTCASVCLGDFLRTQHAFSPLAIDLGAYPHACPPTVPRPCTPRFARDPDGLIVILAAAGRHRLELKARRFRQQVRRLGAEQAFYEETLVALGYKYNTFPFRRVAEALPWRDLPHDSNAVETCFQCVARMRVTDEAAWKHAHVRPNNRPERRLASAALLFSEGPGLIMRLMACNLATCAGQREAAAILRDGTRLGAGRVGAILANAVTPYAVATGRLATVPDWIYPEDVSAPVRQTAFRLLGRDHNPAVYARNGLLIQGLLHIRRMCCLVAQPTCRNCPLMEQIA